MNTLRSVVPGGVVRVRRFHADLGGAERQRLAELGFVAGAEVRCVRRVPFGGPSLYQVGGCVLSVEPRLVQRIETEPVVR